MMPSDARFNVSVGGVIASLSTVLVCLASGTIATPAPTTVAYYKLRIDTFGLYVAPFWFDRPTSTDAEEAVSDQLDGTSETQKADPALMPPESAPHPEHPTEDVKYPDPSG